ncbi:MAG: sulfopyruvate decarboxylase subunit beta [Nitrospirota bacterium]
MSRPEEKLIAAMQRHDVDFTASLPCEKIKVLLEMVGTTFRHLPLTREEEGVGICAGAALAGRRTALFVQSSGLGNMINALLSLTQFYELPLAIFVSRRGVYQEKIEAQFPMGRRLPAMLTGAGIGYSEVNTAEDLDKIEQQLPLLYKNSSIHGFLMSPAVWEGSVDCGLRIADRGFEKEKACEMSGDECKRQGPEAAHLTRYDVIKLIAPYLEERAVVSNLGWPSKELYAIKHQPSNFYMLGSMGMATPVGLGIALSSHKDVVVIDGDGSLLMNPGTLATAAFASPQNLLVVAIDNGAYGSTGNQPTLARSCVDLEQVARGFGFRNTIKVSGEKDLIEAMKDKRKGPKFIHVLAVPGNRDVKNIPVHHLEIKKQVQEFLKG